MRREFPGQMNWVKVLISPLSSVTLAQLHTSLNLFSIKWKENYLQSHQNVGLRVFKNVHIKILVYCLELNKFSMNVNYLYYQMAYQRYR